MAKKETKKPEKAPKPPKEKKGKDKKGKGAAAPAAGVPTTGTPSGGVPPTDSSSVPLSNLSPEQMTAAQLEQAIKESNDPNTRLKKLRSPLNVKGCLINIAILIVVTFAVVVLWCYLAVDKFNFVTVMSDMMSKFGITEFFTNMGTTISGWFGG